MAQCPARSAHGAASAVEGRPISERNLRDWRQGSYAEWLQSEEERDWLRLTAEDARELEEEDGETLPERLSTVAFLRLLRLLRETSAGGGDPESARLLLAAMQQLAALRRADADAERVRLAQEQWETKQEERLKEKVEKAKHTAEHHEKLLRMVAETQAQDRRAAEQAAGGKPPGGRGFFNAFAKPSPHRPAKPSGTPGKESGPRQPVKPHVG